MDSTGHDALLRRAAFSHVDRLTNLRGGVLNSADLLGGFQFRGDRIPLINPQRGIFKPRQMEHLLSIKTVFPRRGARVCYDDQREAHQEVCAKGRCGALRLSPLPSQSKMRSCLESARNLTNVS